MRLLLALAALFGMHAQAQAQTTEVEDQAEIEVMVLGTYHWSNPGRDVVNMQVDDFLSPRRQREIRILAETLAQWQPTRIVVETVAPPPALVLSEYENADELLLERRSESVQLGYRLGRMLDHETVYGFDEQPSDGEPDYFPFGAVQEFAAGNGQQHAIDEVMAEVQARTAAQQAALAGQSVAQSLIVHNDPAIVEPEHWRAYYAMLRVGDGHEQPGAELNAYWYMRNAKMFAKLDMVAEPGDRVLVIVGSGHASWLRHFVERMPSYVLVEAMPFLLDAAAASEPAD